MVEKMTVAEILQIIEDNGISVSDFAYGEIGPSKDFKFSPELQVRVDDCKQKQDAYFNHPEYKTHYYKLDEASQEFRDAKEAYSNAPYPYNETTAEFLAYLGIGEWEEVEKYGGSDQGSDWYSIKYFKAHDVYIKTEGYYQSHHGTEFEDGYGEEVFPVEKTITVYEYKK